MSTDTKIKITPEFVKTLFDGKKSLLDSGKKSFFENDLIEAIATLRTLVLLEKDNIEGNYFLAAAYKKNGEQEEAKKTLAKVRDFFPEEFKKLESKHSFFLNESQTDLMEQARKFAYSFIKKHFKEELPLFEIFFDSIKELVSLDQLQTKNLIGALGITDKVDILTAYKSPVIIKSTLDALKEVKAPEELSEKELRNRFKENLVKNKAVSDILTKADKG